MENCSGVRVNEITEKTHLSRPAVSHHLQILKDAGWSEQVVYNAKEESKNKDCLSVLCAHEPEL